MSKVISANEAWLTALGQYGVINVANTTPVAADFVAILPLTDCVVNTITENNATGSLNGAVLPAGVLVPGDFTAITLTSGRARLYRKAPATT